jgi:hypothetical protein
MKFYLVDYENVHISGFDGIKKLDSNSKICIFYSQKADTMTFGLHRRLSETSAEVEYFLVDNSVKNGLDFQLTFYAGYLAKSYGDCEIFVVSNDKGYDCLTKLAKRLNTKISRVSNMTGYDTNTERMDLLEQVSNALVDISMKNNEKTELISFIVDKLQTLKTKNAINGNIGKYLKDNEMHKQVCKAIKPLLKDKT